MSTLVSSDSTISKEVPIDYENKVAIYDDYCDDMYAIKEYGTHETCHHDFNFKLEYSSHDSYCVEFAPTIPSYASSCSRYVFILIFHMSIIEIIMPS